MDKQQVLDKFAKEYGFDSWEKLLSADNPLMIDSEDVERVVEIALEKKKAKK